MDIKIQFINWHYWHFQFNWNCLFDSKSNQKCRVVKFCRISFPWALCSPPCSRKALPKLFPVTSWPPVAICWWIISKPSGCAALCWSARNLCLCSLRWNTSGSAVSVVSSLILTNFFYSHGLKALTIFHGVV